MLPFSGADGGADGDVARLVTSVTEKCSEHGKQVVLPYKYFNLKAYSNVEAEMKVYY